MKLNISNRCDEVELSKFVIVFGFFSQVVLLLQAIGLYSPSSVSSLFHPIFREHFRLAQPSRVSYYVELFISSWRLYYMPSEGITTNKLGPPDGSPSFADKAHTEGVSSLVSTD